MTYNKWIGVWLYNQAIQHAEYEMCSLDGGFLDYWLEVHHQHVLAEVAAGLQKLV